MKKILIYSILSVLFLYLLEQVIVIPYSYKTIIKVPLFLIIPFILNRFLFRVKMKFKMNMKTFCYALTASLLVFAIIIVTFWVTKQFIQIDNIAFDIQSRMKIDKGIIIIAALYTIFINSFIEEYFFRGFIFQGLIETNKKLAFVVSSLLFAIYHIGVFYTWFSFPIMCLALLGLFIGGLIFSFFAYKTKSILTSYFIHIGADIAIMIIGVVWIGVFA